MAAANQSAPFLPSPTLSNAPGPTNSKSGASGQPNSAQPDHLLPLSLQNDVAASGMPLESSQGEPRPPIPALFHCLPVVLQVSVPVREFRVRRLLALIPGVLIETQWGHGEDLPLSSGAVQLAWTEFEVVESKLAVRVTRLP